MMKWILLVLAIIIPLSFNSCGQLSPGTVDETILGNPLNEELKTVQIAQSVCSKLKECNSTIDLISCTLGVLKTGGASDRFGLSPQSHESLFQIMSSEMKGTVAVDPTAVNACVLETARLSCSDAEVMNAYVPTAANPYLNFPEMIPQGEGLCSDAYRMPVWSFVDRKAQGGINISTEIGALDVSSTTFNSQLYAIWEEGGVIRVAIYNADDSSPVWSAVDNGGLNRDRTKTGDQPILQVVNSQLYALWIEQDSAGVLQLRSAVYNNTSGAPAWSLIDGGRVAGLNADPTHPVLYYTNPEAAALNGKLYVAWTESSPVNQIQVARYDGAQWKNVSGSVSGINRVPTSHALAPSLAIFNDRLYASWAEQGAGTIYQIRIAVYNGNDADPKWVLVDGGQDLGLNVFTSASAGTSKLAALGSRLYVGWEERTANYTIHFKVFNGDHIQPQWTTIDRFAEGNNFDMTREARFSDFVVHDSRLYASWAETALDGHSKIRVSVYDGNDPVPKWQFDQGLGSQGLNFDVSSEAYRPKMSSFAGKLYSFWHENGQIRSAVGK
jgi:hypothetical protein